MSPDPARGTVFLVGGDRMAVARVEAALRELAGWCAQVVAPRQLRALAAEQPGAIVVAVLGDGDLVRALRTVRQGGATSGIIAMSTEPAAVWTPAARALGLRAALPVHATAEELRAALTAVSAGLLAVHPDALRRAPTARADAAPGSALTAREREILELMADGASNRMIATRLGISRHTAKFHVAAILAKLGARTRAEAVAVALRQGLFTV